MADQTTVLAYVLLRLAISLLACKYSDELQDHVHWNPTQLYHLIHSRFESRRTASLPRFNINRRCLQHPDLLIQIRAAVIGTMVVSFEKIRLDSRLR